MRYIKQILFSVLLLSLLICFFVFGVSAAPLDDQITMVYGDYSRTYNTTGCNTWRDLVAKDTPTVNFLSIDRYGRVVYNYTDNYIDYETFVVCDEKFLPVYADNAFKDTVYTFGTLRLMFDGEPIYSFSFDSGSFWFDFTGDSLDPGIFSDDHGYIFYRDQVGILYQVNYDDGTQVSENDDVSSNHYYLQALISFKVDFIDASGSVVNTVTFTGSFPSFDLNEICDDNVVVLDDLSEYYFDFSPYGQAVLVDDFTGDEYYLISDGEFMEEVALQFFATGDPCSLSLHPSLIVTAHTPATCTVDGLKTSKCRLCGEYSEEIIPAAGHNYYKEVIVVEPTCEAEGLKGKACSGCDSIAFYKELPALGHDLDFFKNCSRCDYSENLLSDISSGIRDWFNGNGDSSSGDGEKNLWDQIKEFLTDDSEGIHTTFDGLAKFLSLGLVLVLVLIFYPLLKPLFELLGNLISNGVQAIRSGSKSLSKKVKNYKKKVTNKK